MAQAKTFSLGDSYDAMLDDFVKNGRFETETDAVRAGLRMLADYESRLQTLRRTINDADREIESGLGKEYSSGAELLRDVMSESSDH
ncbi:hypothetical protein BJF92_04350 [Rhizobium rhizosphaerae]|uniref:Antitoxin ParD1/3/4 n=1 Tax=Xaviernesmea rhizosphaerae TaxID=1672749 RepID=A0A1Q9AFR5_9HYPH|nr:type II toxin-antitoxin system ParD family antitoxin [Xaviernesmea rhizosphaerae]OLP53826.1 hypothetical protein BJF92_04350 [Xaviernesmea rhizosphaerae]